MDNKIIRKIIQVKGMTCSSCELKIENRLKRLSGIVDVKAKYSSSQVIVNYESNKLVLEDITQAINKLGYQVVNSKTDGQQPLKAKSDDKFTMTQIIGICVLLLAGFTLLKVVDVPQVTQNMGYGLLFVIGLITSFHCVAMCGGINLSQCVSYKTSGKMNGKFSKVIPSLMYNGGRVISYTLIGGIVGALGSVISFSGTAKGIVAVLAGIFMVIMGLNMLNIFPWLKKFNPRMPKIFGSKIHKNKGKYGPFIVGLLNGLMPCGPLQAMQLYALGTGSFLAGATSMFFFSVGTVPLMFGLGALSSFLSGKFTKKMMKVSAVLVIVLGVLMAGRGFALSGVAPIAVSNSIPSNVAKDESGVQLVTTTLENGRYTPFTVKKGIPVKWTIKVNDGDLNGCNSTIIVPTYNIEKKLVVGDNVIEFTPKEEGNIAYSCWMGMIRSNIKVVANTSDNSSTQLDNNTVNAEDLNESSSANTAGSCH